VPVVLAAAVAGALLWGGDLLVHPDRLPEHAQVAVPLQGSDVGERVRIEGAMDLLRRGVVERVMLSVPEKSRWEEAIMPAAQRYLNEKFGSDLAERVDFCETGPKVDSTEDEAKVVLQCAHDHGWKQIIVVTSNYHTRRAGMIYRKALPADGTTQFWMDGVPDPEFAAHDWWHKRLWAKTWFMESTKLLWTTVAG
jgi:hypothetical protein